MWDYNDKSILIQVFEYAILMQVHGKQVVVMPELCEILMSK